MKNVHRRIVTVFSLTIAIVFALPTQAQEVTLLEPGKSLEREMTSDQTHTYQVTLSAGQFMRVIVEQKGINVSVALVTPDGKQEVEVNFTGEFGLQESISYEAPVSGNFRLALRVAQQTLPQGKYQIRLEVKSTATAQDKQRIIAERQLMEVINLGQQDATPEQRIEKGQQVLKLWRELGDRYWEARILRILSDVYLSTGKIYQAIESFEQGLAIRREIKDRDSEAYTLLALGNVSRRQNQSEKAIEYFEQARAIFLDIKNLMGEGNALSNLGYAFISLKRPEKAVEYFEREREIAREIKYSLGEGWALSDLGAAYQSLRRYERAIEYALQALAIFREIKNPTNEAAILLTLGHTCRVMSRYEKSVEYYEQSLKIYRELKNRRGEMQVSNSMGISYYYLGRYEKAIEYYQQVLNISRELKDRYLEGIGFHNLGKVYYPLGQYEKAIEHFEQGLTIYREIKNNLVGEGMILVHLGNVYRLLGQAERALATLEQALVILREVKNRTVEGEALTGIGIVNLKLNRPEKALEYHEQALAIIREVKDRRGEGYALNNLGEAFHSLNRLDRAIDSHEKALHIAQEIKDQTLEASAFNNLMLDWEARKQLPQATYFGKQAVNVYQKIRSNISSLEQESQQSFLKSKEEIYRHLADLLITQGRLPEAEQVINLLKEEEYFDFIRRDQANTSQAKKAELTPEEAALEKRYREISDQLATLGTERSALLDKQARTPQEEQRLTKLDADLIVAGQMFQKFLDGLANELGKNADDNARVFQLRESQGMMEALRDLGKGTVALYTLVGEDQYRVILTTADVQKGFAYPIKAAELNRKILAFRDVLQNPKLDPLPLAQELYKILVAPLAKDLKAAKAETVMWSLDGVLRYVPMAALHDGDKYLVERWRNVVFTPASQTRLKDDVSRNWKALGLGVTRSFGTNIPALPGVAEEMRGIIKADGATSGVLPGTIKLDAQFTQEAMMTGLRQRPPVVHVASHFQFKPGNETDSALLLGDGQFLSLAQIKSLPNVFSGVELLTLSACNTATGGSGATGKEVEGFGVLAQRQGAKAVIASLWPVADRSTKELMQEFYKLREAKSTTTKAEAMRQAQGKLLRGELVATVDMTKREIAHETDKATNLPSFKPDAKKPYAHPYYWAPFILIGNWK